MSSVGSNIDQVVEALSNKYDADIFLFSATVSYKNVDKLIVAIQGIETRKTNCVLILTTNGGDPDAAYRIVRFLKRKYSRLTLLVLGLCKSSGTLVAFGADEIVIGDFGEFGPLDIQMSKDDEMVNTSGLSYFQSLIALNEQTFQSFQDNFLSLKKNPAFGYSITTKTAAEIASKLAVGLMQPISEQIDPLKLGEVQRSIKISEAYGIRIMAEKTDTALKKLIGEYSSHSFVIDFQETKELFKGTKIEVKETEAEEIAIENALFRLVREEGKDDIVWFLEFEPSNESNEKKEEENESTIISKTNGTK